MHVTQDGGEHWTNVTPPELPEWAQINCIEADPHRDGGCYVAATRYKLDDNAPYVFVTEDYGATWQLRTRGLDPHWFVRTVRADPVRQGLLFAGTERTVWMSVDDGRRWQRLQRNLPLVPVTDLCIRDGALIAATQGRAFWSFDHLAQLRQLASAQALEDVVLYESTPFAPCPGNDGEVAGEGRNPASAPAVRFFVGGDREQPVETAAKLEILDAAGKVMFTRDTAAKEDGEKLTLRRGPNTVRWEWHQEDAKGFDGMVLWSGDLSGPREHMPGDYRVRLTFGEKELASTLRVLPDVRSRATSEEMAARHRFVLECRDSITRAHEAITAIRSLREQMTAVCKRVEGDARTQLETEQKAVDATLTAIETALYQTQSKSNQDPLNYPIKLTDKLAGVMSAVNGSLFAPTAGQIAVKDALLAAITSELERYEQQKKDGLARFNELARRLEVPYVK